MSEGDVALREGLARWLAQRQGVAEVEIADLHRPTAGYSSETIFVDASWPDGATTQRSSLVIRMATAQVGTFPNYNLVAQGQAQRQWPLSACRWPTRSWSPTSSGWAPRSWS
jgi:hypothetical protein